MLPSVRNGCCVFFMHTRKEGDPVLAAVAEAAGKGSSQTALYERWWTDVQNEQWIEEAGPPELRHPAEQWELVEKSDSGRVIVARASGIGEAQPGEWLSKDRSTVLVERRKRWSEPGFAWASSKRLPRPTDQRWRVRLYVPGCTGSSLDEFAQIASALELAGLWFDAKCRIGFCGRRDQIVIWLSIGDALAAQRCINQTLRGDASRRNPPPLCVELGVVGIAHDPPSRNSYGMQVSSAVVVANDLERPDLQSSWELSCDLHALRADKPWRHLDQLADDPWRIIEAEAQ